MEHAAAEHLNGGDYDGDEAMVIWDERIISQIKRRKLPPPEKPTVSSEDGPPLRIRDRRDDLKGCMKVEAAGYFARMSVLGTITNWWEEINDLASHMKISDEDDPSWYAVETDAKKLATYASAVYSDGG